MKPSWLKYFLYSILIILIAITAINYSIEYIVNHRLENIINYNAPGRLYNYTFSEAKLNIFGGDLEIKKVKIIPRKKTLDSLAAQGKNKRIVLEGSLNTIKIKNLDILNLVFYQKIVIDSFIIINPNINAHLNSKVKKEAKQEFTKDLISSSIHYGEIKHVWLENATLKWIGKDLDSTIYFSCDSVSILVKNIYTDSSIIKKDEPVIFSELLFKGKNFHINTIEEFLLSAKEIDYCYTKNKLTLQAIKFRNTLNKTDFTKHQKHEKEWYDVSIKEVTLSSKNTLHWSKGGYIHVNKVCIDHPSMLVYKDKRLKNPPFIEKKLPSYAIRHIPFPLLIDTIEVHNGTMKYQEIVETGKTPGEVSFTHFNLQAYHLTNIEGLLKKNDLLNVNITTDFLGSAPIEAHVTFHLMDSTDMFHAYGIIKNMHAVKLNKTLTNMAFIEFEKGFIESMSFDFKANEDHAKGTLDAHYKDLRIAILDTSVLFHNHKHKDKTALGWVANTLLKKNNIPNSKHYIQGQINAKRPKNKAITNYFWTAIKSGLLTTAVDPKVYKVMTAVKKK